MIDELPGFNRIPPEDEDLDTAEMLSGLVAEHIRLRALIATIIEVLVSSKICTHKEFEERFNGINARILAEDGQDVKIAELRSMNT